MNNLSSRLSENRETFRECRIFMMQQLNKTKEQVLALEDGSISECVPLYIKFIEYKDIKFTEALLYYYNTVPDLNFWSLILATIGGIFKKIENDDLNFIPY